MPVIMLPELEITVFMFMNYHQWNCWTMEKDQGFQFKFKISKNSAGLKGLMFYV